MTMNEATPPNQGDDPGFHSTLPLTELQQAVERLRGQVGKVIVGQDRMIDLLLIALLCDGHVV